jgi:inhibitor of the pro-sigma K processing machinery
MVSLAGLVLNAVVGLLILFVANAAGIGVQVSLVTLVICAILGVPGAILVIVLAVLDIAFVATLVPLLVAL